jgi:hypothetical protein
MVACRDGREEGDDRMEKKKLNRRVFVMLGGERKLNWNKNDP